MNYKLLKTYSITDFRGNLWLLVLVIFMTSIASSGLSHAQANLTYEVGNFTENADNTGSVVGNITISLSGETFTNADGTLTEGADYIIINNPIGLIPAMVVAADGMSAVLTFSGNATSHLNTNDIDGLIFTFHDSAFTGGNAGVVANSTKNTTLISVDYNDNPVLTYGKGFDFSNGATKNNPGVNVDSKQKNVQGVTISSNGDKFYVIGGPATPLNKVTQYNLSNPFNITSGVTFEGQLGVGPQDEDPVDLKFSPDGMTLFVLGDFGNRVHQYQLTTPFDVTGTVTHQGSSFNFSAQENFPTGFTFSTDGMKMYIIGRANNDINQYTLHAPFDITQGAVFDGSPFAVGSQTSVPEGLAFNGTGTRMIVADRTKVYQYSLSNPFDITSGVAYENVSHSYPRSNGGVGIGMDMNQDGSRMYTVVGSAGDDFADQHTLTFNNNFTETIMDDGAVIGDLKITITGDTFANQGGVLSPGTHFSFSNLPPGLVASMAVSADGLTATLTLSGNAFNNREIDSVDDLLVTFTNAAFTNSDANQIANAINAGMGSEITFTGETTLAIHSINLEKPEGDFFLANNFSFAVDRIGDLSGTTNVNFMVTGDVDASDFFDSAIPSGTIHFINGQATAVVDLEVSGDHTPESDEAFTVTLSNPTNQASITTATANGTILNDDNTVPILDNPITDLQLVSGFISQTVDLTNVFSDADNHALSYMVSSSNSVVSVEIFESGIRVNEGSEGTATVTVTADDGFGGNVTDEFEVTVTASNTAPVVESPIADETLTTGFETKVLDVGDVFSDTDSDPLTLSVSSDNTAVIAAIVSGTSLTLTEVANGSANVTVTADDGRGGIVSDEFSVSVNATENAAPAVVNTIADQNLSEGFGSTNLDLSGLFADPDGDALTLTASSSNPSIVTAGVSGTSLAIGEVANGSATITVAADDGKEGITMTSFAVTVSGGEVLAIAPEKVVRVYPNPASEFILVETSQDLTVRIYDLSGNLEGEGRSNHRIKISDLAGGVYFILLEDLQGNTTYGRRFIKQ